MDPPAGFVNLEGTLIPAAQASVSVFDHGLLYGCGLFETLRVREGRFFRVDAHLARQEDGARQLGLSLPWERDFLRAALRDTAAANGMSDGVLRLTVTGGEGPPVPTSAGRGEPYFFITARPVTPLPAAVSACLAGVHPYPALPPVKSLSYLPFFLAREEARRRGFHEALLTCNGAVIEGSTSNPFAVRDGVLVTPPLESGCLPGIARAAVLEVARDAGIPVSEEELAVSEIGGWEEAFLTNSVAGILPLDRIEEARLPHAAPGPVTLGLTAAFDALVRRESARAAEA
jgi:branched-chain amino acid aminotransferase